MKLHTYEELTAHAIARSTKAQAAKLKQYTEAGWRITKVDGLVDYDAVVCIALQGTPATIEPNGQVTRASPGRKTVSYKFPKTRLSYEERRAG